MWIVIPLTLFILLMIFKYISMAVEEYVATSIQEISDHLGMSDSLAAITLLASANGAADLMTVLIAGEEDDGISYNIGALYGGGLFIGTAALSLCIFQAKRKLRLNWMILYRLILFYIIATLITIAFAIDHKIHWWETIILLALYVLLVIIVVYDDHRAGQTDLSASVNAALAFRSTVGNKGGERDLHQLPSTLGTQILDIHQQIAESEIHDEMLEKRREARIKREEEADEDTTPRMLMKKTDAGKLNEIKEKLIEEIEPYQKLSMVRDFKDRLTIAKKLRKKPIKIRNCWEWFNKIVDFPFEWILHATVLPCEKEQYSRTRCLIYCFPGMFFVVSVITKEFSLINLAISVGLGLILFATFYVWLPKDNKTPKGFIFMNVLGLIAALLWTYLLVTILVDFVEGVGMVSNLNKTFLGLTILAVGASMPEAVTTVTLCKQQESIMAISGAYSGQLFAVTVAFGISMLKLTLKEGAQDFDLFDRERLDHNALNILVIFANLFVLVSTFIYALCNKFKLERKFGFILLTIYILFIITAITVGIRNAVLSF